MTWNIYIRVFPYYLRSATKWIHVTISNNSSYYFLLVSSFILCTVCTVLFKLLSFFPICRIFHIYIKIPLMNLFGSHALLPLPYRQWEIIFGININKLLSEIYIKSIKCLAFKFLKSRKATNSKTQLWLTFNDLFQFRKLFIVNWSLVSFGLHSIWIYSQKSKR